IFATLNPVPLAFPTLACLCHSPSLSPTPDTADRKIGILSHIVRYPPFFCPHSEISGCGCLELGKGKGEGRKGEGGKGRVREGKGRGKGGEREGKGRGEGLGVAINRGKA